MSLAQRTDPGEILWPAKHDNHHFYSLISSSPIKSCCNFALFARDVAVTASYDFEHVINFISPRMELSNDVMK